MCIRDRGYIRLHPLPFAVFTQWRAGNRVIGNILKVGVPIALQDFLTNLSFLIITSIVNTLGVVASAGVGISEKLFVFLSIVPMAFMSALSTFVAQNMGAGNKARANRSLILAQRISFCCGLAMFLLTFFGGHLLASIFTNDPEVLVAAAEYMRGSSPEYLMVSLTFCFLGYFNGREHTAFVMVQDVYKRQHQSSNDRNFCFSRKSTKGFFRFADEDTAAGNNQRTFCFGNSRGSFVNLSDMSFKAGTVRTDRHLFRIGKIDFHLLYIHRNIDQYRSCLLYTSTCGQTHIPAQ